MGLNATISLYEPIMFVCLNPSSSCCRLRAEALGASRDSKDEGGEEVSGVRRSEPGTSAFTTLTPPLCRV